MVSENKSQRKIAYLSHESNHLTHTKVTTKLARGRQPKSGVGFAQEILRPPKLRSLDAGAADVEAVVINCVVNRHHFQLACLEWTQKHESGSGGWKCFFGLGITALSV
jgi:hypothetical protein